MKTANAQRGSRLLAALSLVGFASSAFAASTWTWIDTLCSQNGTSHGNSYGCTSNPASGPTATATAWLTAGGTSAVPFATATLVDYGSPNGFGVTNRSGTDTGVPQHTIDNNVGTDLVAFSFSKSNAPISVALNELTVGWRQYGADVSILAYTGSETSLANAVGKLTLASPGTFTATTGWTLVANIFNAAPADGSSTTAPPIIDKFNKNTPISSSWWLISAYNSGYGTTLDTQGTPNGGTGTTVNVASGYDFFKVLAVAGDPKKVPEPGSLALMGVALFGMMGMRRKARTCGEK